MHREMRIASRVCDLERPRPCHPGLPKYVILREATGRCPASSRRAGRAIAPNRCSSFALFRHGVRLRVGGKSQALSARRGSSRRGASGAGWRGERDRDRSRHVGRQGGAARRRGRGAGGGHGGAFALAPAPLRSEQVPKDWWAATGAAMAGLRGRADLGGCAGSGLRARCTVRCCSTARIGCCARRFYGTTVARGAECAALDPLARRIAGNPAMPGFTAPKLLWVRKHEPDVFAETRACCCRRTGSGFA